MKDSLRVGTREFNCEHREKTAFLEPLRVGKLVPASFIGEKNIQPERSNVRILISERSGPKK